MSTKDILNSVFEDHNLATMDWDGQLVWKASEVSVALGYTDSRRIASFISREWADEFVKGDHFFVLSGQDLTDFAVRYYRTANLTRDSRSVLLLTEPGIDLVILKTRKPAGKRLRYHLSSVVLPQFRRDMIQEQPLAKLEAQYQREIAKIALRAEGYAAKVIERDERIIQMQDMLGGALPSLKRQASNAGKLLGEQKKTKKLRDLN